MNCPICNSIYSEQFKYLNCESFDNSYLYKDICIQKCNNCNHMYNELSDTELKNLKRYYEEEYAPSNLSSKDKNGDRPGSYNIHSVVRYEQLYKFVLPYIKENSRILDVGCAMGGFLKFLKNKRNYTNLYGIEPIEAYVKEANNENIKQGNVYKIPFEDNSFDIVILDQVLEHLSNLKLAMKEIKRVLDKGGLCYIGVPDSERYHDIYWYIIPEHIQHFKDVNIKLLAQSTGFELINISKTESNMIGTLKLPNLSVILKVTDRVYCWGIGKEFMYYYPITRLKYIEDLVLVDDTPQKQKQTFKGKKIYGSDILKEADKDSFLIITAMVHKELLIPKALELGFKGEIIDV